MTATSYTAPAPVTRRVRAYFAPVNRATQTPTIFDAAGQLSFNLDAPPAPWISLGWIQNFQRKAASKTTPVQTGIPASPLEPGVFGLDQTHDGAGDRFAAYEFAD
jgi:hypothetical protein